MHVECSCKVQLHPLKPVTQQQPVAHSFHSSLNQYCIMLACCSCATVNGSTSSVEHITCSNSKSTTNQRSDTVCMQGSSSMMMWCMLLQQNTARNLALLPEVHNRFAAQVAHRMACTTGSLQECTKKLTRHFYYTTLHTDMRRRPVLLDTAAMLAHFYDTTQPTIVQSFSCFCRGNNQASSNSQSGCNTRGRSHTVCSTHQSSLGVA
jgi:hypothetical protein